MTTNVRLADLASDPARLNDIPDEDLPELLAALERLRAQLWSRIARPSKADTDEPGDSSREDRLLDVEQVAEILEVDSRYVYDHADDWPFTRKLSPRKLRFSKRGLFRWLESRR